MELPPLPEIDGLEIDPERYRTHPHDLRLRRTIVDHLLLWHRCPRAACRGPPRHPLGRIGVPRSPLDIASGRGIVCRARRAGWCARRFFEGVVPCVHPVVSCWP